MKNKAEVFRALGNEVRLSILMVIYEQKECWINVGEIQRLTGYPQSTVSQHLAKLRDTKIVKTQSEGTKIYYKINNTMVDQVLASIQK